MPLHIVPGFLRLHTESGLEKSKGGPCLAFQLQRCRGVCVGKEAPAQHELRLIEALAELPEVHVRVFGESQ